MPTAPEITMILQDRQPLSRITDQPTAPSSTAPPDACTAGGQLLWPLLFPYRPPRRVRNVPSRETRFHGGATTQGRPGGHFNTARPARADVNTILVSTDGNQDVAVLSN